MNAIIEDWGMPVFWQRAQGFPTLVLLILEQQVSLESGAAMYRRLIELLGAVTPGAVLRGRRGRADRDRGHQAESRIPGLARPRRSRPAPSTSPPSRTWTEEEARARLLAMRGIGPWTADAYLLSALLLPDAFPVGDRALQVGVAEALGLQQIPAPDELEILSAPWRPVRAVAARLVWHLYLSRRGPLRACAPGHVTADGA